MKNVRCNFCGSPRSEVLFPSARVYRYYDSGARVVRCTECGFVYSDTQPGPEEIDTLYSQAYYGEHNVRFMPFFEGLVKWFRRRRAHEVMRLKKKGSILDVGCGRGHFLMLMAQAGWDVYGTEINSIAAGGARAVLGDCIRLGELSECGFTRGSFDCISMYHVLEHTADPSGVLDECSRLLKPGGILLIAVPNIDCWSFRILGPAWFGFALAHNNYYFSAGLLVRKLAEKGFGILRVNQFSLEQDPFSFLQGILNLFCGKRDYLYSLLHHADKGNRPFFPRLAMFLSAALLAAPAALFSFAASRSGKGGTVEIYAIKQ